MKCENARLLCYCQLPWLYSAKSLLLSIYGLRGPFGYLWSRKIINKEKKNIRENIFFFNEKYKKNQI